jgi:hypothetical protein
LELTMAGTGKIVSFVLGVAAVIALAGGGAYFVFDKMSGSGDTAVRIVELVNKPYTVGQATEVFDRPMASGKFLTHIQQGGSVGVVGIVDGNAWLQIALPGNQVGYIPAATVPGAIPDPAAKVAATPVAAPAPAAPLAALSPPAEAAPAPPPDASAPPADAANGEPEAPPPADMVDFQTADRQASVVQPTGLFLAPNERAPQAYVMKPGTQVQIIAVSKDGKWGWVNVSDGTPAYLKLADLSGPTTSAAQQ